MDVDTPLKAFGGKTAYEVAVAGFSKHVSQQNGFPSKRAGNTTAANSDFTVRRWGLTAELETFENVTFSDAPDPLPPKEESTQETASDIQTESSDTVSKTESTLSFWYLIPIVLGAAVLLCCIIVIRRKKEK